MKKKEEEEEETEEERGVIRASTKSIANETKLGWWMVMVMVVRCGIGVRGLRVG